MSGMMSEQTTGRREPRDPWLRYQMWILQRTLTREAWARQRIAARRLAYRPTISLITPVYNTPPDVLRRMLDSVRNQTYPFWQHCLVDDGSGERWIVPFLERYAQADDRIVFRRRPENGNIVAASNDAFALATGEFVGMLDHDDKLAPHALYAVARLLNDHREADLIYSDWDLIDLDGRRAWAYFKPDWSPDLLLSINFIVHFEVYRRGFMRAVGGFRKGLDGAQDYDLALRATERTDEIFHIPDVLYHWCMVPSSGTVDLARRPPAYEAGRRALADHLARTGCDAVVEGRSFEDGYRIRYRVTDHPLVTLIVPVLPSAEATLDSFRSSLASILRETEYRPYEIVVPAIRDRRRWARDHAA
jgi:O-antigen biosynthesis protein